MKNSKNHGASALFNVLKKKSPEEKAAQAENRGKVIDQVGGFAQKNPEMAKAAGKAIFGAITGGGMYDKMGASSSIREEIKNSNRAKRNQRREERNSVSKKVLAAEAANPPSLSEQATGGGMYDKMGAGMAGIGIGIDKFKESPVGKFAMKMKERGQDHSKIPTTQLGSSMDGMEMQDQIAKNLLGGSMYDKMGASKYSKPKAGASMATSTYQGASMDSYKEKESTMDDYSHEKKLGDDGRFELEKGDTAAADNDFNHAHALKEDAKYDKQHVVNRISASRSNLT